MISKTKRLLSHANLNVRGTFFDKKNVIFLILAIGLMVFGYGYKYDWTDDTHAAIGGVDIAIIVINSIVIGIFRSPKSYRSYLIFNLIFRFVYMVLVLIARDVTVIATNLGFNVSGSKLEQVIYYIRPLIQLGFVSANIIILPFFLLMAIVSMIEASWTIRVSKGAARLSIFLLFSLVIMAFMPSIMEGIQKAQEYIGDKFFNSTFQNSSLNVHNKIFTFITHLSFILWFPLLMKINSLLKTELFPNYQYEMGMGVKISFTTQILKFIFDNNMEWLAIIILALVLISASFAWDLFVWSKSLIANIKQRRERVYIPYVPSKLGKRQNTYVYALLNVKGKFPKTEVEKAFVGRPSEE